MEHLSETRIAPSRRERAVSWLAQTLKPGIRSYRDGTRTVDVRDFESARTVEIVRRGSTHITRLSLSLGYDETGQMPPVVSARHQANKLGPHYPRHEVLFSSFHPDRNHALLHVAADLILTHLTQLVQSPDQL